MIMMIKIYILYTVTNIIHVRITRYQNFSYVVFNPHLLQGCIVAVFVNDKIMKLHTRCLLLL